MGLDTKEGEQEDAVEPVGHNSSVQVFDALSPHDSKEALSTTSQKRQETHQKQVDSSKKSPTGINFIQNSSAKMKLPPAIPAKSAKDRVFGGGGGISSKYDNGTSSMIGHTAKFSQSHSSSFITDHKPPSRDQRDEASRNAFGPQDDDADNDRSMTMTTFHNGNILMDGAFREEDAENLLL